METLLNGLGMELLLAVLCAVCTWLGNVMRCYLNDERKRSVAASAAAFVEQVWQELHGEDKLNKALETAEALLRKRGISFDAEEMRVLIEAAVAKFNAAVQAGRTLQEI